MVFGPVQAGTGGGSAPVFGPVKPKSNAQKRCEGRGGIWNEETKECSVAEETAATDKPVPSVEQPPERAEVGSGSRPLVIEDAETGEPIGIRRNGVTTFLPRKEIENIVRKDLAKFSPIEGSRTVAQAEEAQSVAEERARLIAEESPVRRQLDPILDPGLGGDPEAIGGEAFPIVGPLGTFAKKNFGKFFGLGLPGSGANLDELGLAGEDQVIAGIRPEELRTQALTAIEKNEIEKGLSSSENVGQFVEALQLGGLTNFIAEKPAENVQTVLRGIRILKTRATDAESKVISGLWPQSLAKQRLYNIELEIQEAESRIKMLIQESPELKFNSDGVDFIELKLLEARERVFNAKLGILEGKSSDPSDIQIIVELQRSINEESYDIPGQ